MGAGLIKIEMQFLSDVYVKCDVCDGMRYNKETLEVKYKGKSIYDILKMTVDEACDFFYALSIKARSNDLGDRLVLLHIALHDSV